MSGTIYVSSSISWDAKSSMFHVIIDRIRPAAEKLMDREEAALFFSAVDSNLHFLDLGDLSPRRFSQIAKLLQDAYDSCKSDPVVSKWYDGHFLAMFDDLMAVIKCDRRYSGELE